MQACVRSGRLEEGMAVLRDMLHRDVPRDTKTYNIAMSLCKGAGEWTRAVGLLDVMEADGRKPDLVTFNTIISACETGADLWTAFSLFNRMEACGLTPDLWTYNSLVSVCGSCGEWERARDLLPDMRQRGVAPDVVTYSSLISACQRAGQVDESLHLLGEMCAEGIMPNERTFSTIIKASDALEGDGDEDGWARVAGLHRAAKARGKANVVTYSAALSACARRHKWKEALRLLQEMQKEGIEPNDYSYSAAMWACINAQEPQRALSLFQKAAMDPPRAKGVARSSGPGAPLSQECYFAAVTACDRAGDFMRAQSIIQDMRAQGIRGNLAIYNLALSMCERFGDADTPKKLLGMMREDRVTPSVVSCNRVIAAFERTGNWRDAVLVLNAMLVGGIRPTVYTLCSTLRACCLGDSPARASEVLDSLRGNMGGAVTLPVYNTLICSFHSDGMYNLADHFYKLACKEGAISHWCQEGGEEKSPEPFLEGVEKEGTGWNDSRERLSGQHDGGRGGDAGVAVEMGVMDLHGYSLPLAHAAVRCALEEMWVRSGGGALGVGDLTIITGVGRGSLYAFQPVLRPEVQRMLMEEFYPPLDSATEPQNPGRVIISQASIQVWLEHNYEAKRPVMARLAAALDAAKGRGVPAKDAGYGERK
ncbi:unnamed protein product [Discosporangium mesarthrocarpum]